MILQSIEGLSAAIHLDKHAMAPQSQAGDNGYRIAREFGAAHLPSRVGTPL